MVSSLWRRPRPGQGGSASDLARERRPLGEALPTLMLMSTEPVTPRELARQLGVDQRAIRSYLREKYGRLAPRHETRWLLDSVQAASVRVEFMRRSAK